MKKKISIIFIIVLVMIFQSITMAAWVEDVCMVPNSPSMTGIITLNIEGGASRYPSWVESEEFSQDGTTLQLDLHIDTDFMTAISSWSYSTQIQPLPPGNYTLEVRAFDGFYEPYPYIVNFTVTPEPATLIFLAIGMPVFRSLTRRKT